MEKLPGGAGVDEAGRGWVMVLVVVATRVVSLVVIVLVEKAAMRCRLVSILARARE